ncbi:hypothetical protein LSM04_002195 [Trypanosoma melophagium]|uniref:uncharacterized protein n=1 Tax=Trypanosoma melophagium TaxID=715481 RepID=UPI00351A407C|nr:hypothetical protein LSM04_002195 [Trypanosoma melophagium]
MDIQACVQLVNAYRPGEEVPPALHEAAVRLTAALADPTPLADGLRPLVKALATAAPHLPERWNDILHALRGVLESDNVPWLHRAFVLKTLPAMLVDAPTTQQKEHGEALCELLVQWSVVPSSSTFNTEAGGAEDARDESTERPNPQERRVALAALLTLPQEYAASIVHQLVAKLPQSLTTCVALLSNPSAHEGLKKEFEVWICSPSASSQVDCAAEIEKKLKEHFPGYGAAKCERCCALLISRERLKSLDDLHTLQADLLAWEDIDASHHSIIRSRLSLAFLLRRATEVVDLIYSHQGEQEPPHLIINLEESVMPLSVLRSLVQLTDFASVTPDSVNTLEMRSLAASLLTIDSADAALDVPLPLVECVFHFLLRSLPCAPASDDGIHSLLRDIIRVSEILLPVMDNAVLKIRSAIPLLRERQQKSNGKTNTEVAPEEDQERVTQSFEARQQSAFSALNIAKTLALLCCVCKKKCLIETGQHQQQHQEEVKKEEEETEKEEEKKLHLKRIAEGLASAARGVAPSWTRERERMLRLDVNSTPQLRQPVTSTTGNRRDLHQHQRPHYPRRNDKNMNHRPSKRRRRDVPLM